jgi:hypothetical protein
MRCCASSPATAIDENTAQIPLISSRAPFLHAMQMALSIARPRIQLGAIWKIVTTNLGSTTATESLNSQGSYQINGTYQYGPFGTSSVASGTPEAGPFQYAGRERQNVVVQANDTGQLEPGRIVDLSPAAMFVISVRRYATVPGSIYRCR